MTTAPHHIDRLARSGGLSMVGAAVSAVTGVVLVAVITRGLPKEDAGTVFTTTALFLIAMAIVQLGAEVGLVRWLPTQLATDRERNVVATLRAAYAPVLVVAVVVAAAAAVAAPWIAGLVGDDDQVDTVTAQVRVLSLFLPIAAAYTLTLAATRAFRTMRPAVTIDSLGRDPLQLLLVVGAHVVGLGAAGFVVAWALPYPLALGAAAVWLALLLRRMRRHADAAGRGGAEPDSGLAAQFWRYTSPRGLTTIAQTLLKRSDIVLVAALRSPGEAALYAAATRFVVFGQLAVQALQQALAPQISAMFARNEHGDAQDVYRTTTAWAMVLAWPVYLVSITLAPWLLTFFGASYTEAAPVVVVLSLAMLVATACGSVDTVLLMAGRSWLSLANTGVALVVNLALNLALIPRLGILGAAIAWAVAILVRNGLPLMMINRMLGMSPFGPGSLWVATSAIASFGVVPVVLRLVDAPFSAVLAAVGVGVGIYVAALWWGRDRIRLTAFGQVLSRRR